MKNRSGARAAIYARMSTDRQSPHSPADQVAHCREFAERRGWGRGGRFQKQLGDLRQIRGMGEGVRDL